MIRKIFVEELGGSDAGTFEIYQNECRNEGGEFIADAPNLADAWEKAKDFAKYHGIEEITFIPWPE